MITIKKLYLFQSQRVMEKYFKTVSQPVGFLSKRVENAIKRLGGDEFEDDQVSKKKETNKRTKRTRGPAKKAEKSEGVEEPVKKQKSDESCYFSGSPTQASVHASKELFINEKLHREEKIPQKEKAQKLSEERKKQAIEIFRTFKGKGKKRTKVFAKKEANLSESSSESN